MARYFSIHTIACLPRQHLEQLIVKLKKGEAVRGVRFVSDSLEGKLLCEFEATNRETVDAFLALHNMRPQLLMRAESEW